MTMKMLIIDGDENVHTVLRNHLINSNFTICSLFRGENTTAAVRREQPDLIIMEAELPDVDGVVVCQEIRKKTEVPILFLSEKCAETDKIIGLSAGGDDYIAKPFGTGELIARIKAHLRRSHLHKIQQANNADNHSESAHNKRTFGDLTVDLQKCTVHVGAELISLSSKEFKLLSLLVRNPRRVFQPDQLYEMVWGADGLDDHRTVPVHISTLRKKVEEHPPRPKYIHTVRGLGYKFEVELEDKDENILNEQL
ncbi:response regulator transcription factor [Salibacterium sp. K-3]